MTSTTTTTISTTLSKESIGTESSDIPCTGLESSARKPQIWEWGADESLWNPDRSRYAGLPPPLPGQKGESDEGNFNLMERVKRANEWLEKSFDMTEDERKQYKIATDAFLKTIEPLDYDMLDEMMGDIPY